MVTMDGTMPAKLATGALALGCATMIALGGLRAARPAQGRPAAGGGGPVPPGREARDNAAAYLALYRPIAEREVRDNAAAYAALYHPLPVREARDNAAAYAALYGAGRPGTPGAPTVPLSGGACGVATVPGVAGAGCER